MTRPTLDEVMAACEEDDNLGFCLSCGEEAFGIEPDGRNCKCESCGKNSVFGAEEILISGNYEDSEE